MNLIRIVLFVCISAYLGTSELLAQNPAAYNHVSSWTNFADFTIRGTDRQLVKEKGVTFAVEKETVLIFHVLVMPDGNVRYVRPPRYNPEVAEFRLGGTDALYDFKFAESDPALGDQWIMIEMLVRPEMVTQQAR